MNNVSNKKLVLVDTFFYVSLFVFLVFTDPQKLPVLLLLIPIIWLFAGIVCSILIVARVVYANSSRSINLRQLLVSVALAGFPSGMLLLSSINQLTFRDVLLMSFISVIIIFYSRRFKLSDTVE